MVTFEYQAITVAGRMMKGTLEAASHGEANEMLAGMGLMVVPYFVSEAIWLGVVGVGLEIGRAHV